jgi:NAD(P)H-dependent FMN reductase
MFDDCRMDERDVMSEQIRLAVVIGSTRKNRIGEKIATWFAGIAHGHGDFEVDVVDLGSMELPVNMAGDPSGDVEKLRERIAAADAYVIVTPEYNHGYPAMLKLAIDLIYAEWQAKPVGFVSYGGMSGGLRAVEQLRQIFAEMHAVTIRDVVSLHGVFAMFDEGGNFEPRPGSQAASEKLLDQLVWWATSLRLARRTMPYVA